MVEKDRPSRTFTDGAGGFLPGVPLGCLGMWEQDYIGAPGPLGVNPSNRMGQSSQCEALARNNADEATAERSAASQHDCEVHFFVLSRLRRSAAVLRARTTVLLDVGLHRLLAVASGMNYMARRNVSVMRRCFVASSLVVLGSFLVMMCCMRKIFCNFLVMSCSLLRHKMCSPDLNDVGKLT